MSRNIRRHRARQRHRRRARAGRRPIPAHPQHRQGRDDADRRASRRISSIGAFGNPREIAGGSAANTMAGLASLGAHGQFRRHGQARPPRQRRSQASMRETGVHLHDRARRRRPPTACCLIAVTPDGERSMNTYLGAAREFAHRRREGRRHRGFAGALHRRLSLGRAARRRRRRSKAIEIAKAAAPRSRSRCPIRS